MPTQARPSVYFWATWLTPILAGDAQCAYAPWFRGHFTFDKLERGGLDLARWKIDHGQFVAHVAAEYATAGWTVYLEGQNKFTLQGMTAMLAGKPDLVVVRGDEARVIDCKTGQRRDSDLQQVCLYMLALPKTHRAVQGRRLIGEVRYRTGAPVEITPEQFTDAMRLHLGTTIQRLAAAEAPPRVPSADECGRCDIGCCPDRVERETDAVAVTEF